MADMDHFIEDLMMPGKLLPLVASPIFIAMWYSFISKQHKSPQEEFKTTKSVTKI